MGNAMAKRDWAGEAEELCGAAEAIKAVNADNEEMATDIGAAIASLKKEMDSARLAETAPLREKVAEINDHYAPIIGRLSTAIDFLRKKFTDWKNQQRREAETKRRELEAEERARKEALKKAEEDGALELPVQVGPREIAPPPPANTVKGSFGTATDRKTWKSELVDMKKLCQAVVDGRIPEDVLGFQTSKATSLARGGMKFDPETDGIRAWQETTPSFN